MRILHVIPSLDRAEGGPSHALPLVEHALAERGHEVITASTVSSRDSSSSGSASNHHLFPRQSEFYKVSLPLTRWVKREVRNFDLVHIHALFSHSSVSAARCAAEAEIPFIIRPLGVLNQYGVQNRRRWLKKWSIRICEAPLIRKAAAMHFTSEDERKEAEMLGIEMNSKVIPLGIQVPDTLPERKVSASRTVLFLSRLDPKKNIESLLEAWSLLPSEIANTWILKIAGNGDTSYVNHLKELSRDLQVAQRIEWCGFVEGTSKERLFEEAELYILPSFSENFGIAA
ncbi:MAG: glycosyltransferase, partial [Verrucomicrobiota bacterium]